MRHKDTVECVQLLSNSVTKVFNLIDKELERCTSLSNGCALSLLIDAIKAFLKIYVEDFKQVVLNLKERKTTMEAMIASVKGGDVVEDWDTFRHFVRIIQIVGELIIKDEHYEDVLKKQVQLCFLHRARSTSTESHSLHSLENTSPGVVTLLSVTCFKDYLLDDTERMKLNTLVSIIESGNL